MALIETLEPVSKTLQSAAAATGNGQIFELGGKYGALTCQVVIATTATVTFEASQDGTNFIAIRGINKNTGAGATTATASGIFTFAITGIKKFRARISSWGAGAVTVTATAVPASEPANQATTTTGTVAIDQTTPGTTNGVQVNAALPAGTNNIGDVDIASAIPTGTNIIGKIGIDQTTPGTTNAVSLTGRGLDLETGDNSQSSNVAISATETVTITPAAKKFWRLKFFKIYAAAPSGATSGTHKIQIHMGNSSDNYATVILTYAYNVAINLSSNTVLGTVTSQFPATADGVYDALNRLFAVDSLPLIIKYTNNTDAIQTGARTIITVREVEDINA